MNTGERYVVLGVAPVRREWFRVVGRWANEATLPIEFIRCISTDELFSRLESGRPFSAALIDAGAVGVDRDLFDVANSVGCTPIVIDHGLVARDWAELGARVVLPDAFSASELAATLAESAQPIRRSDTLTPPPPPVAEPSEATGRIVAVTGVGGQGASLLSMALAQGMSTRADHGRVLLADLALRSAQAMMHDARDVVPGLTECIEAHRLGVPDTLEATQAIHRLPDRGYDLLLGLRHERDWMTIPGRALDATFQTFTKTYGCVVADVNGDFDGEEETGSTGIDDRNRLARTAVRQADVVVAVGTPTARGIHQLVRTIVALAEAGVDLGRVMPVVNRAPRRPRARASLTSAIADLVASRVPGAEHIPNAIHLPERSAIEDVLRDGAPLPAAIVDPLTSATSAMLEHAGENCDVAVASMSEEPVPVLAGSLGVWSDDD